MIKFIKRIFGIKSLAEKIDEKYRGFQVENDRIMAAKIEACAKKRYFDWKEQQDAIAKIDKSNSYWRLQVPVIFERNFCQIYYVYHAESAKYLNANFNELIERRVEELKKQGEGR